jgi:hypothetical protein
VARFRRIAQRIRNAVADGTMRPAVARQLWRRLANAVAEQCGRDDGGRDGGGRDDGGRDDGGRGDDFRG